MKQHLRGPKKREPRVPDPTQEQIAERCKEVQDTWSDEERLSRIVDPSLLPYSPAPWYPPTIAVSELPVDIYNMDEPGEFADEFDYSPSIVEEEIDIELENLIPFEEYLQKVKE